MDRHSTVIEYPTTAQRYDPFIEVAPGVSYSAPFGSHANDNRLASDPCEGCASGLASLLAGMIYGGFLGMGVSWLLFSWWTV